MTENKQALPGHETQSQEMNCPNCGRFVGAVTKCAYCGSKVEKRISLTATRWAAVLLATIGLFLLYLMAKHREIPVVLLGDIQPTMNFGQIRVVGQVDSDARTFKRGGGMGFNVSDGTGSIMVFVSAKQAKDLAAKNLIPKAGDAINFAGGLSISDEESSMRLLSVKDLSLTRSVAATVRLADIDDSFVGKSVEISGKVVALVPPPADSKRPYDLKIADASGEQTINFWQMEYDQIPNQESLSGAFIKARVSIASYKEKLQLKLASGLDIQVLDDPPVAAASLNPAKMAAATYAKEKAAAPRDFSRGRSGQVDALSVSAITPAQDGQTVRVRGRVESVSAPQEGSKQPFAVVLKDGEASLRVVYWPTVDQVIAVKPTPGAMFEMEGVVSVYENTPQIKVESGCKIKPVDAEPGPAPAAPAQEASKATVDTSQAVAISSITAADKGQTRLVKGTLGAIRSLGKGVAYPLTDDSGTIDLILWESLVPADALGSLSEGLKVSVTGEVGEFKGQLQIKATSGQSVQKIQ